MNKKGFTLIELLAVVIILAVIALIATPIVLDVIEDAKLSSAKSETKIIADAVNNYCAASAMEVQMDSTKEDICEDGVTVEEISQMTNLNKTVVESIEYSNGRVQTLVVRNSGKRISYSDGDITVVDGESNTPESSLLCVRAETLHTVACTGGSSYSCKWKHSGETLTFGNLKTTGLVHGDAFDCDVNGDGNHDSETERFYYVNDLNDSTAVLIYYNNVLNGEKNNETNTAYSTEDNTGTIWFGPNVGYNHLPSTTVWNNVNLTNTTRDIADNKGNIVKTFEYTNRAARLLTLAEISYCFSNDLSESNVGIRGGLDGCNFLLENTKYTSSTIQSAGYWLETYKSENSNVNFNINGSLSAVLNAGGYEPSQVGIRPVIEVSKQDIEI